MLINQGLNKFYKKVGMASKVYLDFLDGLPSFGMFHQERFYISGCLQIFQHPRSSESFGAHS